MRRLTQAEVGGFLRVSPLEGLHYLEFLKILHERRRVQRYLEIGTQTGASLKLALGEAVAIDPQFLLGAEAWSARPGIHLFEMTSDDYFAAHNPVKSLGGAVELAFIDGMHRSEFVLRDLLNVERFCSPQSMIVLHDVIPMNYEMTERVRRGDGRLDKGLASAWTGDVWRVIPILRTLRPDLHIRILDCPPTGLVLITHLDPAYRCPPDRLQGLIDTLTASEPSEPTFWSFIETLSVANSRAPEPERADSAAP